ncbi:clathrin interactor 1-like isoform X2 [Salvelinus fontinalis]|uniref:clathrin interactor 1-like isoform X2 n=1 Tax=Salvelinus fontinalis TaxID=8038 RepID=UPI002485FC0B|nr:clathrin interactor 1-like isoform X2 [Salvelinus fontinalis]
MLNMWKVREMVDKATNVVMNYSEIESKVREVTNDDPWGPSGQLMGEIAKSTFMYEQFPEVMNMLWTRMLKDNKKNWRRVYKALLLLAYLIRNGSERVVTSAREHIYDLRSLENYHFVAGEMFDSEPKGKWDEDWDKSKGAFPFSEKLGEISDKIGSTIDDTINKFRKNERDDSPDRTSGNEEDRVSRNGRPVSGSEKLSEFRDEEETVTTTSIQISHATETTTTRKRAGIRSKTVDLGAAAHYTGERGRLDADNVKTSVSQSSSCGLADLLMVDSESSQTAPAGGSSDLLCGFADFSSPAASASLPSSAGPGSSGKGQFGDWNAFSSPPAPTPPSADLFDLIGSNHTSLSASQSMTFSMCGTQSVGVANHRPALTTGLPISRSQNFGPMQGGLLPQHMELQKPCLPSTWSDPSVNISLDFLSPGMQMTTCKPSLNNMLRQDPLLSGVQPPINLTQSFGGLNLNIQATPIRLSTNPMMPASAMGLGMPPTMATGTMGMGAMRMGGVPVNQGIMGVNMVVAPAGTLGMPGMGVGQPMVNPAMVNPAMVNPAMVNAAMVQTKQDAFANFGNFGK